MYFRKLLDKKFCEYIIEEKEEKQMKRTDMRVYAVTDRHWLNGETLYSQVEKALEGGATFIQLREKNWMKKVF